jgi:nucleotide-binding universal stress UspA family protein
VSDFEHELRSDAMPAQPVILHPTDFSASSTKAFDVAATMARDRGARLIVLHVSARPLTTLGGTVALPAAPSEFDVAEAKAQLARIKPPVGVSMETQLELGETVETILNTARKTGCEMIVMGTHGRSGLGRVLMGSIAEQIVRRASCPVLTLRAT